MSQLSRLLCFTTWPLKKKHCGKGAKLASATSAMALVLFFPTTEIGLEIRFFIRLNSLLHPALLWHHWWSYDQFGALKFWANLSEPVFTNWPNRATSIYLEIFLLLLVMLHRLVDSFNFLLGLIRSIKKAAIWSIFQTVVWDLTLLWRNSVNGIRVGSSLSKSSNFEMILKTMLSFIKWTRKFIRKQSRKIQYRAWIFTLCLNRRARLLPYKFNLRLFLGPPSSGSTK